MREKWIFFSGWKKNYFFFLGGYRWPRVNFCYIEWSLMSCHRTKKNMCWPSIIWTNHERKIALKKKNLHLDPFCRRLPPYGCKYSLSSLWLAFTLSRKTIHNVGKTNQISVYVYLLFRSLLLHENKVTIK